jgi:hypothetical protein
MSAHPASLESIQRQMAAAVMQPLTASEEMRETAPDGRANAHIAATFIAPNSRLTAFERLEIYNRQYWFRILGALAEDFPALRAVIGGRAFESLSIAYLTARPSRSFSLRNLGSNLTHWLADNPQFTGRRHALAIDVARIEWAFVEAFDLADREPLTLEQIATLDANSRLALQPHLQLIALDYPADDLVLSLHQREKRQTSEAGVQDEEAPPEPAKLPRLRRKATWVAAHRIDNSVYYKRLAREEFFTLTAIRNGSPLAEAVAAGLAESRMSQPRQAALVKEMFANWAELGWVCAPELESLIRTE